MRDWLIDSARDLILVTLTLAIVALPVALLLRHVHTQYTISQTGYDISRVTREHRALTEDYKKLQVEAAVQGRTERMTSLARAHYNLAPARHDQITIIALAKPDAASPQEPPPGGQLAHLDTTPTY